LPARTVPQPGTVINGANGVSLQQPAILASAAAI
jgi:hypothetical protein